MIPLISEEQYDDLVNIIIRCRDVGYALDVLAINAASLGDPSLVELFSNLRDAHKDTLRYLEGMQSTLEDDWE